MRSWHQYYYQGVECGFRFIVLPGRKILYLGDTREQRFPELDAGDLLAIDPNGDSVASSSRKIRVNTKSYNNFEPEDRVDYVIINNAFGKSVDICSTLYCVRKACGPTTRVIIYQPNHRWRGILTIAGRLGLKEPEDVENWLSITDLNMYLQATGFEVVRIFRKTIFPVRLRFLGPLLNNLVTFVPLFDWLALDQFIVARPAMERTFSKTEPSLTICITVRNEYGNIEPLVQSLPIICSEQEILFVEGHSTDGTREEIERVISSYPKKNVRLIVQPGDGQGDAIRVGHKEALGEIVILYEGDGTSDPEDIRHFYRVLRENRFEFIEGSRFVYPRQGRAMPFFNNVGNILFAKYFSWFLGQNATDVLSGIKAMFQEDYERLYERWGFIGPPDPFGDFELLSGAARLGLKIGEIPMNLKERPYGHSKTRIFRHGLALARLVLASHVKFRQMKN